MLSPAFLRVCCLAVMAPALTKAVRQADGLTLLILPQKTPTFISCKTQRAANSDRLSADSLAGEGKGDTVIYPEALRSDGTSWQISPCNGIKSPENTSGDLSNELTDAILAPSSNVLKHARSEWCRLVGVLTPTAENSDFESTMNEDISETQERMGLLNANTSLDCDFRAKIDFSRQCASPICADMSPKEESMDELSVHCPMGSLLSPPGSPKSVSGESTSTVTAHNPSVVTFTELEDVKNTYKQSISRGRDILSRLRNLQVYQVDRHTTSQLKSFVNHYQKVLSIPCQRPVKHGVIRRAKDSIDLKAEFLQNEDVRNLSTAALVNLVRKYESSNSSGKLHQSNKSSMSQLEDLFSSDKVNVRLNCEGGKQIKYVTRSLRMRVKHLATAVDSDATESSSGGESCDELEGYEDKKLHSIPVHKRAVWTWVFERAPIAKRWTWLQSQVSDLEYRVRQIADLLTQARAAKSSLCFEENHPREPSSLETLSFKKNLRSVNGYLDHASVMTSNGYHSVQSVPPPTELLVDDSSDINCALSLSSDDCSTVSRTRPIRPDMFRKRKLLKTAGLHLMSRKAARLSSVRCNCNSVGDLMPCILCSGRYNNTQSVDPSVMPLLERVALLQPTFHPLLSFEKDVPLSLHFENHLKKSETYYHAPKPGPSFVKKPHLGMKPRSLSDQAQSHSRRLAKHAAQALLTSARYRNSRHVRNSSSKFRNRNVYKKWRDFQKNPFKTKDRIRRLSAASSCSSRQESPVHSPAAFDDGQGYSHDIMRRRRDGSHYDIDNIVIPYNLKAATSFQKIKYKEIITPKWRVSEEESTYNGPMDYLNETITEDISDETRMKLHEKLEIEERKHVRGGATSQSGMARRGRRNFRYDSSGANTPDHLPSYQQDIMFQDSNSFISGGPVSPAISPPATPSSFNAMSDDSQPSGSMLPASCSERRRTISFTKRDRSADDGPRVQVQEYVEHQPFEKRQFPLADAEWEEILKEPSSVFEAILPVTTLEKEEGSFKEGPSSPGSPGSSSSTSSALEDITDPEWTVVRRQNGPDRTLVIKLAKR